MYVCKGKGYVLLFVVRFNSSNWLQIYGDTCSYSSRRSYALLPWPFFTRSEGSGATKLTDVSEEVC